MSHYDIPEPIYKHRSATFYGMYQASQQSEPVLKKVYFEIAIESEEIQDTDSILDECMFDWEHGKSEYIGITTNISALGLDHYYQCLESDPNYLSGEITGDLIEITKSGGSTSYTTVGTVYFKLIDADTGRELTENVFLYFNTSGSCVIRK